MTDKLADTPTIIQSDRDAAEALWRPFGDASGYYFNCLDDGLVVQAFATYRQQIERELRETGQRLLDAIRKARDLVPDDDEGLASDLFAYHINRAETDFQRAMLGMPPRDWDAAAIRSQGENS